MQKGITEEIESIKCDRCFIGWEHGTERSWRSRGDLEKALRQGEN